MPARALLIVNDSASTTATEAMSIASGIGNGLSMQILSQRAAWTHPGGMPVDVRMRPRYNPEMKTATFIVPGLIAIVLTLTLMPALRSQVS